jgi:hypothetical protein
MNQHRILHGQQPVNSAVLESLYHFYQEIEPAQSAGSFDTVMVACSQAHYVSELMTTNDPVDDPISSTYLRGDSNGSHFYLTFSCTDDVAALKLLNQLHQDMQEFIFNGSTIVLPELIRLFECTDTSVLQLHEELEALCIDINLTKVRFMTRSICVYASF